MGIFLNHHLIRIYKPSLGPLKSRRQHKIIGFNYEVGVLRGWNMDKELSVWLLFPWCDVYRKQLALFHLMWYREWQESTIKRRSQLFKDLQQP